MLEQCSESVINNIASFLKNSFAYIKQAYTNSMMLIQVWTLSFFFFNFYLFFFYLYEFCTTPEVHTRVKPPSHAANINAASKQLQKVEEKEYKLGAQTMSIGRRFHNGTTLTEKEDS